MDRPFSLKKVKYPVMSKHFINKIIQNYNDLKKKKIQKSQKKTQKIPIKKISFDIDQRLENKQRVKKRGKFFNPSYHRSFELLERIAHLKVDSRRRNNIREKIILPQKELHYLKKPLQQNFFKKRKRDYVSFENYRDMRISNERSRRSRAKNVLKRMQSTRYNPRKHSRKINLLNFAKKKSEPVRKIKFLNLKGSDSPALSRFYWKRIPKKKKIFRSFDEEMGYRKLQSHYKNYGRFSYEVKKRDFKKIDSLLYKKKLKFEGDKFLRFAVSKNKNKMNIKRRKKRNRLLKSIENYNEEKKSQMKNWIKKRKTKFNYLRHNRRREGNRRSMQRKKPKNWIKKMMKDDKYTVQQILDGIDIFEREIESVEKKKKRERYKKKKYFFKEKKKFEKGIETAYLDSIKAKLALLENDSDDEDF